MPIAPYAVDLSVTVPVPTPDGRLEYRTPPALAELGTTDYIDNWSDLATVLRAHGGALAQVISDGRHIYRGFRIGARGTLSQRLLGVAEWRRSSESGLYRPAMLWTAEGLFDLNPWGPGRVLPLTGFSHVVPRRQTGQ